MTQITKSQLVYEPTSPSEEVLKKKGFVEVQHLNKDRLEVGQYLKIPCEGGPFHTPVGTFERAWTLWWRQ